MNITFCGHRSIPDRNLISNKLNTELKTLFEKNTHLTFYCGGYGEFDSLVSTCIDSLRKIYPKVSCEKIFVTPYITESYRERNAIMKKLYDDVLYPPLENVPYRLAILRRNEWMVDNSDLLIACVLYSWGGAAQTLEYAQRKKKSIINLAK